MRRDTGESAVKLPERVKIGPFWYSIEAANQELQLKQLTAEISCTNLTLKVDDSRPDVIVREAILHEILHGAGSVLTHDTRMTELQVQIVSEALFQTFVENPDVRKFIFEGREE